MRKKNKIIFIAGDSTAEMKEDNERPESGWGEFLSFYIHSDVLIDNHAKGGRSTKSFLKQNRLDLITQQIKEGDYLLIQFGHNDQKFEDPERYTDPEEDYQNNLKHFIARTKEKKAQPVLISSISRRDFIDGKINRDSLGNYPKAMKKVAQEERVPFIDMHTLSVDLLDEIGEEESKALFLHLEKGVYDNYPDGLEDNTHFSERGAKTFAEMIANELIKRFKDLNIK